MDYSDSEIANARKRERKLRNFFSAVRDHTKEDWLSTSASLGWSTDDRALYAVLEDAKAKVHSALCRNFNTKEAMVALDAIVTAVNKASCTCTQGGRGGGGVHCVA
jgi:cysteinyl-tRNA synthetase